MIQLGRSGVALTTFAVLTAALPDGVRSIAAARQTPALAGTSNRITLDLVVTDAKWLPIKDLDASDVELTDSGETRAVDLIRAQAGGGRVIGIFLDAFHVRPGESTARAKTALLAFLDNELREGDMVAIAKPLDPLHAIAFSKDRETVRRAVAAFEGYAGDYAPRTEFERNFMSRDPRTAEATRNQVVSAALQALSRRLGEHPGRKALIFVSEGFRPQQPRAVTITANRNSVAIHPIDPGLESGDFESMLQSLAEQTGGHASVNDSDLERPLGQAIADLDHYYVVTFQASGPPDGRFRPVQFRIKKRGAQARARSGYWAPDAALAAAAERAAAPRYALPFRPTHASRYIRPWIGMSRGSGGRTRVTVAWEPGVTPERNQRIASVHVKATAADGSVLFERAVGAGDRDVAAFEAPPGPIALEMAIRSTSGTPLDTDYRGMVVPNLAVTKPTFATPQVFRTRTARQFAEVSQNPNAVPTPSRTFSRAERLIVRVEAYTRTDTTATVTARLLNRRGIAMRDVDPMVTPALPQVLQFDLPLANLAPDEYRIELVAANSSGQTDQAKETLAFRVTN